MTHNEPTRSTQNRSLTGAIRLCGLLMVLAAIAALLVVQLSGPTSSSAFPPSSTTTVSPIHLPSDIRMPRDEDRRELPGAGGEVADGVTVFDNSVPAVTKLSTDLLRALRRAATDAEASGIELFVNSGWRSPQRQDELLRQAISQYGSRKEAARWVATSQTSAHVSGDAVDIGPAAAAMWLSGKGADYGLCQIYRNEPWHYELRKGAEEHGCPRMYADPTQDPRMRP